MKDKLIYLSFIDFLYYF